jgi:hypothetical protein
LTTEEKVFNYDKFLLMMSALHLVDPILSNTFSIVGCNAIDSWLATLSLIHTIQKPGISKLASFGYIIAYNGKSKLLVLKVESISHVEFGVIFKAK